jgi:putative hydrolase of the HAD superfamily
VWVVPPTAVCFDLDDTLYPYEEYARTGLLAAADTLAARTGHRLHNELADLYFEEGVTEHIFDRLVARHDTLADSVTRQMAEAYHDATAPLEPYHDTTTVLELLGDRHRLGVLAGCRRARDKLARLGLSTYVDEVVTTSELGLSKTDEQPIARLLTSLSVEPSRALYVGDDPHTDFAVPNRIGVGTVRVRRGRFTHLDPTTEAAEADVEIDALGELPALVDASRLE